jgi:glycerophosphoryl diester phosphodiesterase
VTILGDARRKLLLAVETSRPSGHPGVLPGGDVTDFADDGLPESPLVTLVRKVREPALPVLVASHRGDSQNAPENTLAAFSLAVQQSTDLIELDVHQTADGDIVVIHDDKLDRTTDGSGEVHRLRTADVRAVSAGSWFAPRFAAERVPLLDEVLDLCRRSRVVPMIEVKTKWRRSQDCGRRIVQALARHGMLETAVVICRELSRVEEVRTASPVTPLTTLTITKRQARGAMKLTGVKGVDCYWKSLSLGLVAQLRQGGFFLTPWTVNKARDMERLFLLGCESIITDSPVTLRDRIETFEFARTRDLLDRWRRDGEDIDLEGELDDEEPSPEELARQSVSHDSSPDILATGG